MRFIFLIMLMLLINSAQAAITLTIQSDADDELGKGNSYTTNTLNSFLIGADVIFHDDQFLFSFSAPSGERELSTKVYNTSTSERYLMRIEGTDTYCYPSESSGSFSIYELNREGPEQKLALDFVFYCSADSGALSGSLRINSDIPIPYLGPTANIAAPAEAVEGEQIVLQGTHSFSANSALNSYHWEQLSGTSAVLNTPNQVMTAIDLPQGMPLGGEALRFQLTVTDENGLSHSTVHNLHVASKSDPQSYLQIQSSPGEIIGQGQSWSFDNSNSSFSGLGDYVNDEVGISVSGNDGQYWDLSFAAPRTDGNYTSLETGVYPYAVGSYYNREAAGLRVRGNGHSCTTSTGAFEISQLKLDASNYLQSFHASFDQYCDGQSAVLSGIIAINATHESVPEADAGATLEIAEKSIVNLDGSGSYDPVGTIQSYRWQSIDDEFVINNATQSRAYFVAPELDDRVSQRLLAFRLLVTDDEGYQSEDWVNVRVVSANQPPQAVNDNVALTGNTLVISPLDNDEDTDGRLLTDSITIITPAAHGNVIIHSNGKLEYIAADTTRHDSFSYTVKDNDGGISAPATVTILAENVDATGVTIGVRALLQGAYDSASGLMRDDLRQAGLLPVQQPFAATPLDYQGTEMISTNLLNREDETAPVDWLLLELLAADQPDTPVAQKAVVVLRNNEIVDALNPDSVLRFTGIPNGNYYLRMSHRNHLQIITADTVPLTDTTAPEALDFTIANPAYPPAGTHALWQTGDKRGLWAGDADLNQSIVASGPDNDSIRIITTVLSDAGNTDLASNYISSGYHAADLNLDGRVTYSGPDNDNNLLLSNILTYPANTGYAANYIIQ